MANRRQGVRVVLTVLIAMLSTSCADPGEDVFQVTLVNDLGTAATVAECDGACSHVVAPQRVAPGGTTPASVTKGAVDVYTVTTPTGQRRCLRLHFDQREVGVRISLSRATGCT
jgi:hypothetical protein